MYPERTLACAIHLAEKIGGWLLVGEPGEWNRPSCFQEIVPQRASTQGALPLKLSGALDSCLRSVGPRNHVLR